MPAPQRRRNGIKPRNPRTRIAVTNSAVAEQIRLQIVRGEISPGQRLPVRTELEARFGTTAMTVQRAFDQLTADGFIESRGRHGTFVAQHPPHLARYALVFSVPPQSGAQVWSPLWSLLGEEAAKFEASHNCRFTSFYNIDGHIEGEDYRRLLHEIQTRQLAGIIFAMDPSQLSHTPILKQRDVPMAAITMAPGEQSVPTVLIDYKSFFDRINSSGYSDWNWGSYRANATYTSGSNSGPMGRPDNSYRPKLSTYVAPATTALILEGISYQFGGTWVGGGCTGAQNCQSFIGGPAFSIGSTPLPYVRESTKNELLAWHL